MDRVIDKIISPENYKGQKCWKFKTATHELKNKIKIVVMDYQLEKQNADKKRQEDKLANEPGILSVEQLRNSNFLINSKLTVRDLNLDHPSNSPGQEGKARGLKRDYDSPGNSSRKKSKGSRG